MTIDVNYVILLLRSLIGSADYDDVWHLYENVNSNNENDLMEIINREIIPSYNQVKRECQLNIKSSLAYFLRNNTYSLEYAFFSCLIAFNPPDDIRLFFILIYERLYDDNWQTIKIDDIVITNDIFIMNKCL